MDMRVLKKVSLLSPSPQKDYTMRTFAHKMAYDGDKNYKVKLRKSMKCVNQNLDFTL